MNANAAAIVAKRLLEGARDTLRTMLTEGFEGTVDATTGATPEELLTICGEFPVVLTGVLPNNMGGVALLLSNTMALSLAGLVGEQSGATTVGDAEKAVLVDLADTLLSGAVAHMVERAGQGFGQFNQVVCLDAEEAVERLPQLLGAAPVAARCHFSGDQTFSGQAALVFSGSFEELLPAASPAPPPTPAPPRAAAAAPVSPLLSQDEMQDILNGFGLPAEDAAAPPGASAPAPDKTGRHENLDVVLDIGLTAVARLGGIEMPIGDILSLGPGAIIEVGHLVDEPVELLVNGRLIAKGEVVVVDERFGLRITEIVSPRARIESLR